MLGAYIFWEGTSNGNQSRRKWTTNKGKSGRNKVSTREKTERGGRTPPLGVRSIQTRWPKYLNYSEREQGGIGEKTLGKRYYCIPFSGRGGKRTLKKGEFIVVTNRGEMTREFI